MIVIFAVLGPRREAEADTDRWLRHQPLFTSDCSCTHAVFKVRLLVDLLHAGIIVSRWLNPYFVFQLFASDCCVTHAVFQVCLLTILLQVGFSI